MNVSRFKDLNAYKESTEGFFYLNAIGTNNSTTPIIMSYDDTSTSALLNHQEEYKVCCVRFEVPSVPFLFEFESDKYYVSFSYGGSTYTTELVYVAWNSLINTSTKFYITDYQQWCDMINTAASASFALLKAGSGSGLTQTNAPKIYFDSALQKFVIKADDNWTTATAGTMLWSNKLAKRIPTFPSKLTAFSNTGTQILIYNMGNNVSGGYAYMYQQSQMLRGMNDVAGLVITTNLNIRSESLPFANNGVLNVSASNFRKVLTDFHIAYDLGNEPMNNYITEYIYNIQDPDARSISIVGQGPFTNINFTIYWFDHDRNLHEMYLQYQQTFSVKILFTKKAVIV